MSILVPTMIRKAGVLPAASVVNFASRADFEALADEHWVFSKGNSQNLTGLKAATALTQVGSNAPTHNSNSLTMSATDNNSLHSGVADQLTWSAFAVVKVPATGAGGGLGKNVFTTNGGTGSGGVVMTINGSTSIEAASRAIISGASSQVSWNAANLSVGSWLFVGFAIDHTGSNRLRRFVHGPFSKDFTDAAAFTPHPSKYIAIGNTSSDVGGSNGTEYAEFGVKAGTAFTLEQFAGIYARAKARMFRLNGITLS